MQKYTHNGIYHGSTQQTHQQPLVPTLHSNCVLQLKDFKYNIKFGETVNLWWSAVRGTRGQPVILNTLGLA